ncbi:MAG TPA: hypothetical protein VH439_17260 [Gemmatimonadales bacterium]
MRAISMKDLTPEARARIIAACRAQGIPLDWQEEPARPAPRPAPPTRRRYAAPPRAGRAATRSRRRVHFVYVVALVVVHVGLVAAAMMMHGRSPSPLSPAALVPHAYGHGARGRR